MFKSYVIITAIVNLPEPNFVDTNILSKPDYTVQNIICQEPQKSENTINYNYIKSEDQLESLIQKYQDVIP